MRLELTHKDTSCDGNFAASREQSVCVCVCEADGLHRTPMLQKWDGLCLSISCFISEHHMLDRCISGWGGITRMEIRILGTL